MFLLKKILTSLILPPTGPLLLIVLLLGIHAWRIRRVQRWHDISRRLRLPGRTLPVLAILIALSQVALSLPVVGNALLARLETLPPLRPEQLKDIDAIVILGNGTYYDAPEFGGDTVGTATLERLRYGARLARDSWRPVLVSGGAPFGGTPEAESMKRAMALDFGIDVRWVEVGSGDTAQNARESARILLRENMRRIALVSHAWHLPRAVPLFAAEGLEVTPAPTAFTTASPSEVENWLPSANALRKSQLALHEMLGRWVNQASGVSGKASTEGTS